MKITDQIITANHNLFRNKTRTFLTILAVFIGSFTIILSNAVNSGVNDFIDKQVSSVGGDDFIMIFPAAMSDQITAMTKSGGITEYNEQTGSALTANITNEDLEKLRAVDGVKMAEIYHLTNPEWITSDHTDKKYLTAVEYFPSDHVNIDVSAGRMVDNKFDKFEILLNEQLLEPLGFKNPEDAINKTVRFGVKQSAKCYLAPDNCIAEIGATITGVQAPGVLNMDGDNQINFALYQEIYRLSIEGIPNEIVSQQDVVAVGNINPEKVEQIREDFKKLGFDLMTIDDEVGLIRTFFDVVLIVFNIFGAIALLAASIGIINTLFMSVQERTREIGLMKAMGLSSGKIFFSFALEATLLGFWGSVVGIVVSMIVGHIGNDIAHQTFLSDFPTFQLVIFDPLRMGIITLIIMAIAFLAGTLPARRASHQNPIDALRYE